MSYFDFVTKLKLNTIMYAALGIFIFIFGHLLGKKLFPSETDSIGFYFGEAHHVPYLFSFGFLVIYLLILMKIENVREIRRMKESAAIMEKANAQKPKGPNSWMGN